MDRERDKKVKRKRGGVERRKRKIQKILEKDLRSKEPSKSLALSFAGSPAGDEQPPPALSAHPGPFSASLGLSPPQHPQPWVP